MRAAGFESRAGALLAGLCLVTRAFAAFATEPPLREIAGPQAVVYAVDASDHVVVSQGADLQFLPASTLKLFTTLLAIDQLGLDYRFRTELYLRDDELIVRGFGDPFLVSEELDRLAAEAASRLGHRPLAGIAVDDSFFSPDVRIPGVGRSSNPYDALNAAVAVNFNTIAVRRVGDRYVSAEPQTPMTPLAASLARARRVRGSERIQLGDNPSEVTRYAGELIAAKLRAAGVRIGERVSRARAPQGPPLLVHRSSRTLADVCRDMLAISNNFVANQVFLTIGAEAYGAPASLAKARRAAHRYLDAHPLLTGLHVVEGSGIAYENEATATAMTALLKLFEPYRSLLKADHGTQHKTGTLQAIATVAGYLDTDRHGTVRYVVAVPGDRPDRRWQVVAWLRRNL